MNHENKIAHHASNVAYGTTVSRILGYIRDMLVAHAFGAGFVADAFYAAFRIPNLLRRLFGEGALSASFIPVLSEYLHTKTKEETQYFINVLFTALMIVLSLLTLIGVIFSNEIVTIIAYGFKSQGGAEKLGLTVTLTQIMFPFVAFVCLAALLMGILNTLSSFFLPAVAPAALSVAEIGYVLAIAPMLSPDNKIKGLAWSVVIGGIGHFLVQIPKLKKLGWSLKFTVNFKHPAIKRILFLMFPAMLGLSVDQINAFVNTFYASFLEEGTMTALYYSNRLMQMPLAIFGLSIASVALPAMAKASAHNDTEQLTSTLKFSIRLSNYILVPSAVGLMMIGIPIIMALFEHGRFTHAATIMTNIALFCYCVGLPAYASSKLLANVFYSKKDTKTPVKVAVYSMILNIVLMILLKGPLKIGGLALATSLSSWFNALVLAYIIQKRYGIIDMAVVFSGFAKTAAASLIMGVICSILAVNVFKYSLPGVAVSLVLGVLVYYFITGLLKMEERKQLLDAVLRKTGRSASQ